MPLILYLFLLIISSSSLLNGFFASTPLPTVTIMLHPAGDTHHSGRQLHDGTEQSATFGWAQHLKNALEQQYPYVQVIITHQPGQSIAPLQAANFANRLHVDLYITLCVYQELAVKPAITLYRFSYGDDFVTNDLNTLWVPYDQAYRLSLTATTHYAQQLAQGLSQDAYKNIFSCHGPYALPISPLMGLNVPAFVIEAGVKNMQSFMVYVTPIIQSFDPIINTIATRKRGS